MEERGLHWTLSGPALGTVEKSPRKRTKKKLYTQEYRSPSSPVVTTTSLFLGPAPILLKAWTTTLYCVNFFKWGMASSKGE